MIKDLAKTADFISKWIDEKLEKSNPHRLKRAVIGISGGVDSALVAALCAKNSAWVTGVLLPCQSNPDSLKRGEEVINKFGLHKCHVDLEPAYTSVVKSVSYPSDVLSQSSLRSCLRAPVLDYVAKTVGGLIVGTGNRDEDEVTRYFQKRGDGCVDISPIAKLHKSEVYQLAEYLDVPESVLKARPSADLLGGIDHFDEDALGMTYDEIEEGIRLGEKCVGVPVYVGTIGANWNVTAEHLEFAQAHQTSPRMLKVLQKLAEMERSSRHKANPNIPVCNPRMEKGLLV